MIVSKPVPDKLGLHVVVDSNRFVNRLLAGRPVSRQATVPGSESAPTNGKLTSGSATRCRRPAAISISAFLMGRSSSATSRHRTSRDTASLHPLLRRPPSSTVLPLRRRCSLCRSLRAPHHRTTVASLVDMLRNTDYCALFGSANASCYSSVGSFEWCARGQFALLCDYRLEPVKVYIVERV